MGVVPDGAKPTEAGGAFMSKRGAKRSRATQFNSQVLQLAVVAGSPALVWGEPGVGKTSFVEQLALSLGRHLEVVVASLREPADFAGLPLIHGREVHLAPPRWAVRLAGEPSGLLFLDEITTAPPAVQAALLRVVVERTVGELALPESVGVIAAANPADVAAGGWELSPALANRFVHLEWRADVESFTEGLVAGWPAPEPVTVPATWRGGIAAQNALVAGFLRSRPELRQSLPQDDLARGRAWPSHRTWTMAARLAAVAVSAGAAADVTLALLSGCVGGGPAVEFLAWAMSLDLPDPEELLRSPAGLDPGGRPDQVYAILSSVVGAVAANPTVDRWQAGWSVLARVGDSAVDVAVGAARSLARLRPLGASVPVSASGLCAVLEQSGIRLK
ncbi:MAG: AAA family ATPase [Acidimicrobiales bacterium]